jgi:NDP-sugar pyrophosphorylase family protein
MESQLTLDLFVDLSRVLHGSRCVGKNPFALLGAELRPWIEALLTELGVADKPLILGKVSPGAILEGRIYVAEGAHIEPTAYIQGPCYIGPGAEVRHGAYIRGDVYVGAKAVVGHTSEVKGSILFDEAKAAHFAYLGNSILGRNVNLGAGTKLANLPLKRKEVRVVCPLSGRVVSTGLKKFGAIMGDDSQTGCNAVLSPGTLLLKGTAVMPCVHYRGTLKEGIVRESSRIG